MRFAVISDVHGNVHALDAVLADIALQGADATLCLGDHVSGPLDPAGAADRLMTLDGPVIRGNHDRELADSAVTDLGPVDRYVFGRLTEGHRAWLAAMPATDRFSNDIFLCHGTPDSDTKPWLDNWYRNRTSTLPGEAAVEAVAEGIDCAVMLCGHTHMARSVRLRDGRLIVNPGSVGLQLFHGSPDARYAVIERRDGRWFTDLKVVPYDHAAAGELAVANGFPKWRAALTTGWTDEIGLF